MRVVALSCVLFLGRLGGINKWISANLSLCLSLFRRVSVITLCRNNEAMYRSSAENLLQVLTTRLYLTFHVPCSCQISLTPDRKLPYSARSSWNTITSCSKKQRKIGYAGVEPGCPGCESDVLTTRPEPQHGLSLGSSSILHSVLHTDARCYSCM